MHRDVKPSNVLIKPDGHVKLIDMGLARFQQNTASNADLTASGVTLGTFDYISPEQARDPRTADARSDIYSLGCTFFFMLTGRPPFPEGTVLQKLLQHQGDEPPDIRHFRPEVPEEAARLLRKMLAKDPRHRYGLPADLVTDLVALADQIGLRPVGPGGRIFMPPPAPRFSLIQRHLPWIAPVAALLCIVTVLHLTWNSAAQQSNQLPPIVSSADKAPGPGKGPSPVEPTAPSVMPPRNPDQATFGPLEDLGTHEDRVPPLPISPNVQEDPARSEHHGTAGSDPSAAPPRPTMFAGPLDPIESQMPSPFAAETLGVGPEIGPFPNDLPGAGISTADGSSRMLSVAADRLPVGGYLSGAADQPNEVIDSGQGDLKQGDPKRATAEPGNDSALPAVNVLVVNEGSEGENVFSTLGVACAQAVDGDVIELRYDGRREERPITLTNLNVEIRAGRGYQPAISFRPGTDEINPVKDPRTMLTVTAGHLTLTDVALELHLSNEIHAENWSLLQTRGTPTVTLKRSSLSIHKPESSLTTYREEVAFFHVKPVPGAEVAIPEEGSSATTRAVIRLQDCVVRGEAVLVRAEDSQPLDLIWENGLLVTSERLLSANGGRDMPRPGQEILVDLRHLTAVVRSGLCCTNTTTVAPFRPRLRISCTDSILIGVPDAPLIEQIDGTTADTVMEDFQQGIQWTGARNFFEGFEVFSSVTKPDWKPFFAPMTLQQYWRLHGKGMPELNRVRFKNLPETNRPLHTHTPADYALAEPTEGQPNPAVEGASRGRNAGFLADRLPKLYPLPAEEPVGTETLGD